MTAKILLFLYLCDPFSGKDWGFVEALAAPRKVRESDCRKPGAIWR